MLTGAHMGKHFTTRRYYVAYARWKWLMNTLKIIGKRLADNNPCTVVMAQLILMMPFI